MKTVTYSYFDHNGKERILHHEVCGENHQSYVYKQRREHEKFLLFRFGIVADVIVTINKYE
ncbi:MAG: hypothetical protein IKY46_00625 [Clostridia bacterium]|nr:hypothetical protein [Clostridia bacterium]